MRKFILALVVILSFSSLGIAQNVIEPQLQNVMNQKGDEMININIVFKSQMDPAQLNNRAKNISDKKVRRDVLVDELKIFAEKEQHEVLSILNAEAKSDKVSNIECRWMTNYINCNATRDVIYLLAEHPDVMMIGYNEEKYLLWDEKSEKVETGKSSMTENITMVNADDVWDLGYTGHGVVVAVIDTGVNYNHIDIADHLWDGGYDFPNHGYNIYYNNNDPMDEFGHGTHCAGTICGDGTSGLKTGIAPDARLMCVKALSDEGGGTVDHVNEGMEWAIEHHADILSLSLGIPMSSATERSILRNTCVTAMELGVIAAVAAGNEGNLQWNNPIPNNVRTPGNCPPPWLHPDQADVNPGGLSCVVAVGAVNYEDEVADFSSRGPVTWQETEYADYEFEPGIGLIRPDIAAPGVGIISLDYTSNNSHTSMNGTSMATPCVAGVMALMLEKKADLTPAEICMILETTAVKLTNNKVNTTGSGRIDALAAMQSIESGDFKYVSYAIDDEENGNGNANLNALEQVKLHVTFENDSEESYNNVKAVLRTSNIMVRIDDSIAQINSIGANETVSITEGFAFLVDETANYREVLGFDVYFYDDNDEVISYMRIPVALKAHDLEFSSVIIRNDDNGNGILEAGETADFGVVLNNIGNEIIPSLIGTLSCEDNNITINNSEASFSSIGNESSGVAFFNVTMSNNVSDVFNIPFEMTTTNMFEDEDEFTFDYANKCNIIFELKDSYGDGWSGAALVVKFDDGTPDDAFTIIEGSFRTFTKEVTSGVEVTLEWSKGSWDIECSFNVKNAKGNIIYTNGGFLDNGYLYSWVNNCSTVKDSYEMCEAVQNLQISNTNMLSWEAPESGNVLHYEVYKDSKFLGTTEELNFVDESYTANTMCTYSVRPVYNECYGYFSNVNVHHVSINEDNTINASIYPNPSQNDFNIVCDNMRRITVYNIVGNMIMDIDVNGSSYTVSGLNAGVYFINIETANGNIVKKVVKM